MFVAIQNTGKGKKIIFISIIVLIITTIIIKSSNSNFIENSGFDSKWKYTIEKSGEFGIINIPGKIYNLIPGDTVIVENTLPNEKLETSQLILRSNLQRVQVYLEDNEIYSLDKSEDKDMYNEPSSQWIFIDLPNDFGGKKIKIKYTSSYVGYSGNIGEIYLGNGNKNILMMLEHHGMEYLAGILLFTTFIISIITYLFIRKINKPYVDIIYLGLINFIYFLLIICKNISIELFYHNSFYFEKIKFIAILCLPIACITFCIKSKINSYNLIINRFILTIISLIVALFYFGKNQNFEYVIYGYYLFIGLTIINIVYQLLKEIKLCKEYKNIMDRLIISGFLFFAIIDIIFWIYIGVATSRVAASTILIAFTLYYYNKKLKIVEDISEKEKESEIYKKLAFTDALTGLNNRLSFEEKMMEMNKDLSQYIGRVIFIFDLNNLKKINDTFGHSIGDDYIRSSSNIFNVVFKKYGYVYRIGGDEFVFISNKEFQLEKTINLLDKYLKIQYKGDDYKAISYGYRVIDESDKDIYNVYSIADNEMYKVKAMKKNTSQCV